MFSKPFRLGVLGGGQLGAILIRHAVDFGLEVHVMDADPTAPCARYSPHFTQGSLRDAEAVKAFAHGLDALTIEIEAVNVEALKAVRDAGLRVYPSPEIIEAIQDKGTQKERLQQQGIPIVPGVLVEDRAALKALSPKLPAVLKLRRDGYDGKGVMMLRTAEDLDTAFDAPSVVEELVDIGHEIAVIVARGHDGKTAVYDPVRMVFDPALNLLDYQVCPAGLTAQQEAEAKALALRVAKGFDLVGILAIEMFVTADGRILVNELAPRPHNSGHHTIEACATSQYEALLRCLTHSPMGSPATVQPSVMVNLIEPAADAREAFDAALRAALRVEGAHLHWYGKGRGRAGRKLGHITFTAPNLATAQARADLWKRTANYPS